MRYLQTKNVDLVYNLPALVRVLDKFARYLYEMNIDEQEFQPQGRQNHCYYLTIYKLSFQKVSITLPGYILGA